MSSAIVGSNTDTTTANISWNEILCPHPQALAPSGTTWAKSAISFTLRCKVSGRSALPPQFEALDPKERDGDC